MADMRVGSLWRYPVKSMQGEAVDALTITSAGVESDRTYGFVDVESGRVVSAKNPKRYEAVFGCHAELLGEGEIPIGVTLPDGTAVQGADIAPAVSRLVGRELVLAATSPEGSVYEEEWPEFDGVLPDTLRPVLGLKGEQGDQVIALPTAAAAGQGSFVDFAPVHAMTTRTLAHLSSLQAASAWEARRFRPNLLIDDGDQPGAFTEDGWIGDDLLVGEEVRLRVSMPTPRCVMTTLAQDGIPRDPEIMRTVAEHNKHRVEGLGQWACAGAYLEVVQGGVIHTGDTILVVPGDVEGPGTIAAALEGFRSAVAAGPAAISGG